MIYNVHSSDSLNILYVWNLCRKLQTISVSSQIKNFKEVSLFIFMLALLIRQDSSSNKEYTLQLYWLKSLDEFYILDEFCKYRGDFSSF